MSDYQISSDKMSEGIVSLLKCTVSQLEEIWETIGYPQEDSKETGSKELE